MYSSELPTAESVGMLALLYKTIFKKNTSETKILIVTKLKIKI